MGLEIERKFLVERLPTALANLTGAMIRQGYIVVADGGVEPEP